MGDAPQRVSLKPFVSQFWARRYSHEVDAKNRGCILHKFFFWGKSCEA